MSLPSRTGLAGWVVKDDKAISGIDEKWTRRMVVRPFYGDRDETRVRGYR